MKDHVRILFAVLLLLTTDHQLSTLHAQGTAFIYQGQLQNNDSLASGTYNLVFSLYTNNIGGTAAVGPVTNSAVIVTNGLFTVTIDFGPGPWDGKTNWLQIGVETNHAVSFNTLSPRQQITPVPYAITAENVEGAVSVAQLTSIGNTNGGFYNFFVGLSGNAASSGYYNTADGVQALNDNASGSDNSASGFSALASNTSGSGNTADGVSALFGNTIGSDNTAVGLLALSSGTTGSNNIAVGHMAGYNISGGSFNIDIGNQGLSNDTNVIRIGSGQAQTFIAGVINGNAAYITGNVTLNGSLNLPTYNSLVPVTINSGSSPLLYADDSFNFFAGPNAGNPPAFDVAANTAIGVGALGSNTSGQDNTASGFGALASNTSGTFDTANGADALASNTSGEDNTASGNDSLVFNTNGWFDTADGVFSLYYNKAVATTRRLVLRH